VPVIMNANLRDGSLRQAVLEHNIPVLLYEGGEALRFDEQTIGVGVRGVLSVMRDLGMLPKRPLPRTAISPMLANDSRWVRAPESGTLTLLGELGDEVEEGDRLGVLASPLGENEVTVRSHVAGVVIGRTMLPLVYEGEAIVNIAHVDAGEDVDAKLDRFEENLKLDNEGNGR
ncbi:MAG: succinylglutamate desuccinylase/aspartoacylase family protein, partial [Rhodothermia bacterium]|nr:succinylglutamate desuccinylase/aspartoacylase family protein [Rhodothermia bacterium]